MNDILKDTHVKSSDFLANRELRGVFNMYFFAVEAQEFLFFSHFLKNGASLDVVHYVCIYKYVHGMTSDIGTHLLCQATAI